MKKLHSSLLRLAIFLGVACMAAVTQGASVGPTGYTNDFSVQPGAADWSTLSIGSSQATFTTPAQLDAAVAGVTASGISGAVGTGVNEPPDFNAVAQWAPSGLYLQTRATGNDATLLMCTLVNNIGGSAASVTISYNFAKVGAANAEEIDGQRVYYSLTGAANSWTNLPTLSGATPGRLSATLNLTWPAGGSLYLLWADDNGSGSPDPAMQIDNFSVTAVSSAEVGVTITSQPQNQSTPEFQPATFTVGFSGNPTPTFQWYRDEQLIPDGTNSTYTVLNPLRTDDGRVFKVVLANTASNVSYSVTSSNATLSVVPDLTAPTVTGVAGTTNQVTVTFSEKVTLPGATNLNNYSINGGVIINSATLSAASNVVQLGTSFIPPGQTFTVSVSGVQDLAANVMIATNLTFTVANFILTDVGSPAIPGAVAQVPGGFNLTAGGSDIGATNSDQFSFEYVQRSGDFDVKVRLAGMSLSDAWAKAGIMARADLFATNLYAATLATPGNAGSFFQYRATGALAPAISVGNFPVTYPNTWLRLQRVGNNFTGYASVDGNAWYQLGSAALNLPGTVYVGIVASSRSPGQTTVVQVRDFVNVSGATLSSLKLNREPIGPSSRATGLAITEIMYHPRKVPGFSNSLEFIEIYNSQGFFEKIGGYKISGSVDYTFPSNTVMQSGSYLVVARDPAFVRSYYGITNVLGPWDGAETNGLPNDSGTVRLRNRQGAVMLEVNYEGKNPWPIAADGAGHSLALVRASLGERDPRAWAASDSIDGSPGQDDPYGTDPLRAVVINEILAHTENPLVPDFVELYNHSTQPVDLSGAYLSDEADTNKFRIPNGTTIPATGFVYFTEATLGFALNAGGERVFLVNSNQTRVIDVIDFDAQADGISYGRYPDGASTFRELLTRTPGAPNSQPMLRDIVINELMHTPISGNSDDEYVELYNKGTNPVNLSKWKFTSGISFTFPSNTVIAPDGYLVIAKNKTNLFAHYPNLNANNTLGDFSGGLAGSGERVALSMPVPHVTTNNLGVLVTNTLDVVENEVTYGKGNRWGYWNAGGGSSLELVDPHSDNRQAANWADSDETAKGQWINFEFTGPLGETLGTPINDNLQIFLLGIGECLIDEVELHNGAGANLIANPGFESGATNWVFQGSHDFSTIENVGFAGSKSLHLRAASRGDNGGNRIRTATLTTSASGTVTLRAKARWVRGWPEVILRVHGGGAEVVGVMPTPLNLGTPGARNSQAVTNAGPAIWEVQHSPVMPAANEAVVVTARAYDPDGPFALTLKYRVDAGQTVVTQALFTGSVTMLDNGTGGDAVAGDGIYSATIPGQAAGVTVAFFVQAVDGLGATNLFPQDIFPKPGFDRCFPNDAVAHECVVRWGDVQMPGTFATYHLWLTFANSNRWAFRGRATTADGGLDNAELDGTFVYNNFRSVYNALPLYAGSPWHRGQMNAGPCGPQRVDFVMNFPNDDRMLGSTDFVLNNPGNPGGTTDSDLAAQTEQTSYIIFNEIGLVYNHRRYVHYFINGSQRSTTSDRAGNFIFEDSQQPNGDMVAEWFPDDANGELFKIEDWFEFNDNGYDFSSNNDADLFRRTILLNGQQSQVITPYRFMFRKRSVGPGDFTTNYANFFSLVNAVSPTADYSPSGASNNAAIPNPTLFDSIANVEQWMRIFAVQHTVGNWDSYGYNRGKNDYTYKGQNGRFEQLTWDIDFTMGVGGGGATEDLINPTGNPISDQRVVGMLKTPIFLRAYWRAFQDIVNGPLNNSFMDPILDAKAAAMTANNINFNPTFVTTIKTFVTQRRASIQTQLNNSGALTPFSAGATNYLSTPNNLFTVSGLAPVNVETITATINNVAFPATFTSVKDWTVRLVMSPGTNVVVLQSFDRLGNELVSLRTTNTVNYTGPAVFAQDAVVINEIMYNPVIPNASYVEIYNNSDAAFDLSNWRLDDLNYSFPLGTVLAGRGFLIVAKNIAAVTAAAYNGTNSTPIIGEFAGQLNPLGQTIALVKPGLTAIDDLVIDKVRYEAGDPWPSAANGQGAAIQLIDPSKDNARAGNWTDAIGWRFASVTGNFGTTSNGTGTNVLIFMQAAGEAYVDDVSFVLLSGPFAGSNLLQNASFEAPISTNFSTTNWIVPLSMSGSVVTNTYAHSGNYSLHVVATNGGSVVNAIRQLLPPSTTNILGTLSFWYHTVPNSTNINVRTFPGSALAANVNPRPISTTPGFTNSSLASLPDFPLLWLNELQVSNVSGLTDSFGQHDPWVELYNSGTTNIPLDGLYLANTYTNLTQWAFPAGSSINPGQFLIIWADGQPGQSTLTEWHTSFRLAGSAGSVALVRIVGGLPQVMDYLNYSGLAVGQSYGDFPDAQPFARQIFSTVTPGTNNIAPPVHVFINEWVASNLIGPGGYADPTDGKYDDWFELYNPGALPANIGGFYLTDTLANKLKWHIPAGTTVPAGGYLLVWADGDTPANNTNGDLHASFNLAKGGEALGLYAVSGTNIIEIDYVSFGGQFDNISQGRYPDGSTNIYFLGSITPRGPNSAPGNVAPVLAPIGDRAIYLGQTVSFTASATDADLGQTLSYSLTPPFPSGASINPSSGLFQWTPSQAQAPSSTLMTVSVADNGLPTLSDSKSFTVFVALPPEASIISPSAGNISLSFPTISGKHYKVQWTEHLTASPAWTDLANSATVGSGGPATVSDSVGANVQRFYRIVPLD